MKNKILVITIALCLSGSHIIAQTGTVPKKTSALFSDDAVKPRMRIIIDNDFSGDPMDCFN